MLHDSNSGMHSFVVACNGCQQSIPHLSGPCRTRGFRRMPDCGAKSKYLPADIFMGRISNQLVLKPGYRPSGEPWRNEMCQCPRRLGAPGTGSVLQHFGDRRGNHRRRAAGAGRHRQSVAPRSQCGRRRVALAPMILKRVIGG